MKKIILVRHGKSAWDNPLLDDPDRPLAGRGLRDVPIMGFRLLQRGVSPDLILSSTATRAAHTAEIISEVLKLSQAKLVYEKSLYHASSSTLLKIVQGLDDSYNTIFLVGHNPGMNDLIEVLGGSIDNLPTSGQYGFLADTDHWAKFSPNNSRTWFFDYPKKS
ncbi:histidine phosphatase family protein [Algoriphagus sp. AGSA1]|uniref:SixA phosphatase family protein n=1 Tax=Algoriphagus sp. AGSA1 TaxID=2907213 RepID=UPI001F3FDA38|nr:histidine phosphatase family protein [Algoriphagus sp. AGSA1]MCE7055819.1 histidine phosphatase family protein [Algoriphagus sp. AGSA1]